jgi:GNAT superfamily N-acetyltransferase
MAVSDAVLIRAAGLQDIAAVREIERVSATRFLGTPLAAIADDEPTDAETLARRVQAGGLLGAWDGEALVAFAMFREVDGCGYLEQIDVLPSHERRGIGAQLIEAMGRLGRARGWSALILSTFRAVPFNAPYYRRLGFEDVEALTPAMAEIRAEHEARGLDETQRVFMRRPL